MWKVVKLIVFMGIGVAIIVGLDCLAISLFGIAIGVAMDILENLALLWLTSTLVYSEWQANKG